MFSIAAPVALIGPPALNFVRSCLSFLNPITCLLVTLGYAPTMKAEPSWSSISGSMTTPLGFLWVALRMPIFFAPLIEGWPDPGAELLVTLAFGLIPLFARSLVCTTGLMPRGCLVLVTILSPGKGYLGSVAIVVCLLMSRSLSLAGGGLADPPRLLSLVLIFFLSALPF